MQKKREHSFFVDVENDYKREKSLSFSVIIFYNIIILFEVNTCIQVTVPLPLACIKLLYDSNYQTNENTNYTTTQTFSGCK